MENFPEKIYQIRKERNLSQSELAKLVKVSVKTIYRWEKGESLPKESFCRNLEKSLGLKENFFLPISNDNKEATDANQDLNQFDVQHNRLDISIISNGKETESHIFYKVWSLALLAAVIFICLLFVGLGIYRNIASSNLSIYGATLESWDIFELFLYSVGFIALFLIPVFVYETRKVLKHFKTRNKMNI